MPHLTQHLIPVNTHVHVNLTEARRTRPRPPLPMCLRVCSMVELRLTLDSRPRQKRFLLLDGSVKPSTRTLREDAWNVSPTRLLSS